MHHYVRAQTTSFNTIS